LSNVLAIMKLLASVCQCFMRLFWTRV